MQFMKPIVGTILLLLAGLSVSHALAVQQGGGPGSLQLWGYVVGYLVSGGLVLMGKEVGAWFGVTVTLVTLLIISGEILRAGGQVELPPMTWLTIGANVAAFVGAILILRGTPPAGQEASGG